MTPSPQDEPQGKPNDDELPIVPGPDAQTTLIGASFQLPTDQAVQVPDEDEPQARETEGMGGLEPIGDAPPPKDAPAPSHETEGMGGLEPVQDFPQGATEEMTVRGDETGDMPDDKVNAMHLPDTALPSEVAPTVGTKDNAPGDVPTQDNTGGRWNVDTIAPAPPETDDLQEAFNPTSRRDQPHSEVY